MKLRSTSSFLDEAGHVYVALAGPGRSCLRLNRVASELWRLWLSGGPINTTTMKEPEERFLHRLLDSGALAIIEETSREYEQDHDSTAA